MIAYMVVHTRLYDNPMLSRSQERGKEKEAVRSAVVLMWFSVFS